MSWTMPPIGVFSCSFSAGCVPIVLLRARCVMLLLIVLFKLFITLGLLLIVLLLLRLVIPGLLVIVWALILLWLVLIIFSRLLLMLWLMVRSRFNRFRLLLMLRRLLVMLWLVLLKCDMFFFSLLSILLLLLLLVLVIEVVEVVALVFCDDLEAVCFWYSFQIVFISETTESVPEWRKRDCVVEERVGDEHFNNFFGIQYFEHSSFGGSSVLSVWAHFLPVFFLY